MIGDAPEESNHPIIVVNDAREAVNGMLKIKNADNGKLFYSKNFTVDQNDNTYTNHYFLFKPQVDLEVYLKWLPML